MILADDLGWSDVGCYGGEIRTPHIDSLARNGLRFTQFYNNAICGPTRVSLLTGLYPQQVGHRGDRWNEPEDFRRCVMVSELLQRAGYRTMMAGKWQSRDLAVKRGFDRFFGPMCQAKISYFHEVQQNPFYLDSERWPLPTDFYLTDAINDFSARFLEEAVAKQEPFFLYVAHVAPHWPLHAREADIARYRSLYRKLGWDAARAKRWERQQTMGLASADLTLPPLPPGAPAWSDEHERDWQAERMAVYAAQVDAIDRGVGRLLQIVDRAGKTDNTLVLFLSDNGAAPDGGLAPSKSGFGFAPGSVNNRWRTDGVAIRPGSGPDHPPGPADTFAGYGLTWATVSNTPLRGTKLTAYEGGIRTPLIARWPAMIRTKGGLTQQVGHVMDIMATCLDVAGIEYPREFDGRQPLPLEGKTLTPIFAGHEREAHEELCWSVPQHFAIRMGRWKALRPRGSMAWQLYDVEADSTEAVDLAAREPERVQRMADRFVAWRQRVGDQDPPRAE
jgi:arylsulfatase